MIFTGNQRNPEILSFGDGVIFFKELPVLLYIAVLIKHRVVFRGDDEIIIAAAGFQFSENIFAFRDRYKVSQCFFGIFKIIDSNHLLGSVKKDTVDLPASGNIKSIMAILKKNEYIDNFKLIEDKKQGAVKVYLKYTLNFQFAI